MEPLVVQFQGFVTELTTVEKRSIIALTEIARDALRTHPHLAPSLAAVLTNRILQAPADLKLPALYLLDSITKTIGDPYKAYFASSLPEIYAEAWAAGAPGLHRPLEKLLATWAGVFPSHVLDAVRARVASATVMPTPVQPYIHGNMHYSGYPPAHQQAPYDYYGTAAGAPKPMVPDARLTGSAYPSAQPQQQSYYGTYGAAQQPGTYPPQQPAVPSYGAPQPSYPVAGGAGAPPQQQAAAPAAAPVPDLFSLLSSGALAGVVAAAAAAKQEPGAASKAPEPSRSRFGAAATSAAKGKPPTTEFNNASIKEHNPAAIERLLTVTNRTKSNFLDRLFLRRQKHSSGLRASRLWYVDLDTWMAGTIGAGAAPPSNGDGAATMAQNEGAGPASSPEQRCSVVADEEQTHCALSGERFDQFWDEDHQEWRYRDARRLTAEEAASYGLEEGSIVLVSALGGGAPQGMLDALPEKEKKEDTGKEQEAELEGKVVQEENEDDGREPAPKRLKTEG